MKFDWNRSWTQPVFICLIVLYSIDDISPSPSETCPPRLVGIKRGEKKVSIATVYGVPSKPFEIKCEWRKPRRKKKKKCRTTPVLFYFNGQLINEAMHDASHIKIERTRWTSTLIIEKFNESNVGTYQCRIDTTSPNRRRKELTYQAKYSDCVPRFRPFPVNLAIKRYITAKLNCWVYTPLPHECGTSSIQFFRGGEPVAVTERYKVVQKTLNIYYFDPKDIGNYSCVYENKYGKAFRNFSLTIVDPWRSTQTIKHALLPYQQRRVNETRMYFLPMMTKDTGLKVFVKGERYTLQAFFYVGKNMTLNDWYAEWVYRNDSFVARNIEQRGFTQHLNHRLPRYRIHVLNYEVDCPFGFNSAKCYRSGLHFKRMMFSDVGTYTVRLYSKKYPSEPLKFSWTVIYDYYDEFPSNKVDVHVDFVSNATVCLGQNHTLTCRLQPWENVRGLIMRLGKGYILHANRFGKDHVVLTMYQGANSDETQPSHDSSNMLIGTFGHELKNLTLNDSGTYMCAACESEYDCEDASFSVMTLSVTDCSVEDIIKDSIFSNKYVIVIFVVCAVTAIIIGIASCAVHIKARRRASDRSVMKRVVISRPNINYRSMNRSHIRHRSNSTNSSCGRDSNMSENSSSPLIPPRVRIQNRLVPIRQTPSRRMDSIPTYGQRACSDSDSAYYSTTRRDHILYEFPVDPTWEFPRSQLTICELLGSGAFGTVWRGEAQNLQDHSGVTVVAVKMLNDGFDDSDLTDFVKEMEIMKIMDAHPHLIRLLGTCTQNGPLMVLTEYAKHGNLKDFLRNWRNENGLGVWVQQDGLNPDVSLKGNFIRKHDLLLFAKQVAVGMDYLSSKSIVHRDLAARNVLVGENYCMKIADFGMTRTVDNYYKKTTDGRLPVKWLAPESLDLKKFTTKSDVWAFGILMWEIFTFGGTPYPSIPVERLFQLLRQGHRNAQPELADKQVYGIMTRCWDDNPLRRPWFSDLSIELTRQLDLTLHEDGTDYCQMAHPSTSTASQSEISPSTDYSDYPIL